MGTTDGLEAADSFVSFRIGVPVCGLGGSRRLCRRRCSCGRERAGSCVGAFVGGPVRRQDLGPAGGHFQTTGCRQSRHKIADRGVTMFPAFCECFFEDRLQLREVLGQFRNGILQHSHSEQF